MIDFDMAEAQRKIADALDPKKDYSMEDFEKEYSQQELATEYPKIEIGFVNKSDNQDPDWETVGSAGFDLRASVSGSLKAGEFKVVPTGLYFDLPENFELQVRPRSGLAAKHGVTVLNSPGTVDSDYIGEVGVILINHGTKTFDIVEGDRIAQAVIATVTAKNIIKLNKISKIEKDTDRGAGGFGSTGIR